jgi:hypothetical protein
VSRNRNQKNAYQRVGGQSGKKGLDAHKKRKKGGRRSHFGRKQLHLPPSIEPPWKNPSRPLFILLVLLVSDRGSPLLFFFLVPAAAVASSAPSRVTKHPGRSPSSPAAHRVPLGLLAPKRKGRHPNRTVSRFPPAVQSRWCPYVALVPPFPAFTRFLCQKSARIRFQSFVFRWLGVIIMVGTLPCVLEF